MTTKIQPEFPRDARIQKAGSIASAINATRDYAARVWLGDNGKVRVYVSTGVKDIGYIGFGRDGTLICEVSTRGNHAMSVMPIARAAVGEEE